MNSLTLYFASTCPFCIKVLKYIEDHTINLELKNVQEGSNVLNELVDAGGKQQVPCLVVDGKPLYESDDIIEWLQNNYQKSS